MAATLPGETYLAASDADLSAQRVRGVEVKAVIDCAFASAGGIESDDFATNLALCERHAELAAALGARFIYLSSGGTIYGTAGNSPVTEETRSHPISAYGRIKLQCEEIIIDRVERGRLDAIILRPSNIYGPGQQPFKGQGLVATAFASALQGRTLAIFGDGSQVRDYLFVEDFCRAVDAAMTKASSVTVFNVGTGSGVSVNDVLTTIKAIVGVDGFRLTIDRVPSRQVDVPANILNADALRQATGWRPEIALGDGLRATWEWIQSG